MISDARHGRNRLCNTTAVRSAERHVIRRVTGDADDMVRKPPSVREVRDPAIARTQALVRRFVEAVPGEVEALDAGGGAGPPFDLPTSVRLTAVDVSAAALQRNAHATRRIVGDINTVELPDGHFDLAICWDTLEHISDPYATILRLRRAVRPRGLIVLGFPNPWSVKGLTTKFTPLRFHIWVYRHILGSEAAGDPAYGPFPVFLRWRLAPPLLRRFLKKNRLRTEFFEAYTTKHALAIVARSGVVRLTWDASNTLLNLVTLGRADAKATDIVLIARRD